MKARVIRRVVDSKSSGLIPPLFLAALALAFNLHALAGDSFWGDEILTATFAAGSPEEIIRRSAQDIHPPLYYFLVAAFTHLTLPAPAVDGPDRVSDWVWRFPSALAVVLTVAVTYRLACYVSGRPARLPLVSFTAPRPPAALRPPPDRARFIAVAAALLLCLAPAAIQYGQEARMHALFMFLSAFSTLLLFQALARPDRRSRWLAYAVAATANIYTMYFGFLILAAHIGLVASILLETAGLPWTPSRRRSARAVNFRPAVTPFQPLPANYRSLITGFGAALALVFLLYLPWWPVLFDILRRRAAVGAIEGGVGSPWTFLTGVVRALGPAPAPAAWGFGGLFLTGLTLLARRCRPLSLFAALWVALPVALPIFLGDPRALQFRYAFILPLYFIIIAGAVAAPGGPRPATNRPVYLLWLLATLSFIAVLGLYHQTKPNWRAAGAYLNAHTSPGDVILIGPLWDEGRFIDYYYRGQAQLLTPAALVTNIQGHAAALRATGGRVWAVNRFAPAESPATQNIEFSGVVISAPALPVYEPDLLTAAAIDLARQAVEAAYPWAAEAEAQGVLDPDPRTAQAAALRALGDSLAAAGRLPEALEAYQTAVDIFPGWVDGFIVLAETQEAAGNLPAAAEAYRQAVAFNLAWHGPSAEEAARLVETGQWRAALEKYHQIVD